MGNKVISASQNTKVATQGEELKALAMEADAREERDRAVREEHHAATAKKEKLTADLKVTLSRCCEQCKQL